MIGLLAAETTRIGHPILGYIIPAVIFTVSFWIAFGLYKHFSKELKSKKKE